MHEIHIVEHFLVNLSRLSRMEASYWPRFSWINNLSTIEFGRKFLLYLFMNIHEEKMHLNNVPPKQSILKELNAVDFSSLLAAKY